jgi:hypothetical protein
MVQINAGRINRRGKKSKREDCGMKEKIRKFLPTGPYEIKKKCYK